MKRLTKKLFLQAINENKPVVDPNNSWVQQGKPMFVKNILISSGLFHLSHSYEKGTDYENFGISLSLPVDLKNVDYEKRVLPRIPSYSTASPACRGTYIKWLSEGCPMGKVHVGYPLLYLLGMELYFFRGANEDQKQYILKKADEFASQLEHEESFMRHYRCFRSAVYVQSQVEESKFIYLNAPTSLLPLGEFPIELRFAFSQMAYEQIPLTGKWAFLYLINHPKVNIRDSATRVWRQFTDLFIHEYEDKIKDTLYLENKGPFLDLDYKFFNTSCRIDWKQNYKNSYRDVLESNEKIYLPLLDLYESVGKKIISYSRFLARNSKYVGSLYESLKLPVPLRNKEGTMTYKLVQWVKSVFEKQKVVVLSIENMKTLFMVDESKMNEEYILLLQDFFKEQGWEIYPSVVEDRLIYRSLSTLVIYKKIHGLSSEVQEKLIRERHFYFVLIISFLMEDKGWLSITLRESWLDLFFDQNTMLEPLKDSFSAMFIFHQSNMVSLRLLSEVLSHQNEIVEPLFQSVVLFMVEYGIMDNQTLQRLTDVYESCGLSSQMLFHHVNALRFIDKKRLFHDEMMLFFKGSNKVLYGDTKYKEARESKRVSLDSEILKKREDETKQVSELLEGVFVSKEVESSQMTQKVTENEQEVVSEQKLFDIALKKLVQKEIWSYDDMKHLLEGWKISIHDFIEKVNDWSYDGRGEALVMDEGQSVRVYLDVWEDL